MASTKTFQKDCMNAVEDLEPNSVDLIYLDPPFFTQKVHQQKTRNGANQFSFRDIWSSDEEYGDYLFQRITRLKPLLKDSGSIFFHCDRTASHIVRLLLDSIFGEENFQSEIIWYFKRWSNSKKGLLPSHQTIFFYSKTPDFKFKKILQEYSPSTNVDQIMQKRARDSRGKSVYARSSDGEVINGGAKKGVPLSDVWEIPFLNPKAKERVGYPTQKPVLLLNRIIELVTDEGDFVLDPFCGSGTTLVAAQQLGRNSVGYDISEDAIKLTNDRLTNPIITGSALMEKGKESYKQHSPDAVNILNGVDYTPIHRNNGMDGLLKQELNGKPVFVRVQRNGESVVEALAALKKSAKKKGECELILVKIQSDLVELSGYTDGVHIVPSAKFLIEALLDENENSEGQSSRSAIRRTRATGSSTPMMTGVGTGG